jgi:glycerol-3-phosphate dehydrogenase
MPPVFLHRPARRHGAGSADVLGEAKVVADLGRHFGGDLYEREVDHLMRREWAREPEDVLWRRTKEGLHMSAGEREAFAEWMRTRRRNAA